MTVCINTDKCRRMNWTKEPMKLRLLMDSRDLALEECSKGYNDLISRRARNLVYDQSPAGEPSNGELMMPSVL